MARKFLDRWGHEIDLDDPETYKYLPNDIRALDDMMFCEIGKALCYMDYFHPDIFPTTDIQPTEEQIKAVEEHFPGVKPYDWANCGYLQRQRVYALIKDFTDNRKHNWQNIQWFREQVYMFTEETENMC